MYSPDIKIRYTGFTLTGVGGLLREIVVPVKVRVPMVYPDLSHDYIDTRAVWDTGATNSAITPALARRLGLSPMSKKPLLGATGTATVDVYVVDFVFNDQVQFEEVEVFSVSVSASDEIECLIGMDIIAAGDSAMTQRIDENGVPCTVFTYRYPSAGEPVDYADEIRRFNRSLEFKTKNPGLRNAYRKAHPKKKPKSQR